MNEVTEQILERIDELGEAAATAIKAYGDRIVAEAIVGTIIVSFVFVAAIILIVQGLRTAIRAWKLPEDDPKDEGDVMGLAAFLGIPGLGLLLTSLLLLASLIPRLIAPEGYAVREFLQLVVP